MISMPSVKQCAFLAASAALVVGSAGAGIGYGVNKLYFEPKALSAEFRARAQDTLTAHHLRAIDLGDFAKGKNGCEKPLHGATFIAENPYGKVVRGHLCTSRRTETALHIAR